MNLIIDPEYQKLVPRLSDKDYNNLYESIKKDGLWTAIQINDKGVILDGHTRYEICKKLKKPLKYLTKTFKTKAEEAIFVGESNLKRRQLEPLQRTQIVIKLEPYYTQQAKENMSKGGKGEPISKKINTQEELAKKTGLSHGTFHKGVKILESNDTELIDKINNKKTSIDKEYQKIKKEEEREKRHEEIKKIQINLPKTVTLYNQEFQTLTENEIKSNSVSLIFTDPLYHDTELKSFDDLAKHAVRVLKDGGSLLTFVGQKNIPEICNYMKEAGLNFHWPIAVIHSGGSDTVFGRKILVCWKPILWFTKGKYQGEFVKDSPNTKAEWEPIKDAIISTPPDKNSHKYAQSTTESDYYIKYLTIPNEIVYDPFLGSGTFGVSAKKLKRQFIGCEKDADHFETARRLISDVPDCRIGDNLS